MKELNETIKNIMVEHKDQAYVIDKKRYGFTLGDNDYKKVTGVDLETLSLEHGVDKVYGEIRYCKDDEGCVELQYETWIASVSQDALSGVIVAQDCSIDWLELFSTKQEETIDSFLEKFDIKDVLKKISEDYNDDFCDFLGDVDMPDNVKERCASEYISDNPSSSCHDAISYMDSYAIKDVLKDMIDEL